MGQGSARAGLVRGRILDTWAPTLAGYQFERGDLLKELNADAWNRRVPPRTFVLIGWARDPDDGGPPRHRALLACVEGGKSGLLILAIGADEAELREVNRLALVGRDVERAEVEAAAYILWARG